MNLKTKELIDAYAGGPALALLRPMAMLLGFVLRRSHDLTPKGDIGLIKMLGGGSLVIAYPALLGIKKAYPNNKLVLFTTPGVKPFAETLGVFDEIHLFNDRSFFGLTFSFLRILGPLSCVDTFLDVEVYSRLTTIIAVLSRARNRIGFFLENTYWSRYVHTHLIFFNRFSGTFNFYEKMAHLIGATPATPLECREYFKGYHQIGSAKLSPARIIAIGHGCSDLAAERMLNMEQWLKVFRRNIGSEDSAEVLFLGVQVDAELADQLISTLKDELPKVKFDNLCGKLSLIDSVKALAGATEFWGIDSALLHYSRLLGLPSETFWGPTSPISLLKPVEGLSENIHYADIPCSPCIHIATKRPCRGNNVCIEQLFEQQNRQPNYALLPTTRE